jgi:hypothetical protein
MSYNHPQFYGPNGPQPPFQGQIFPSSGVSVQIQRTPSTGAQQTNHLSVNGNGYYPPIQNAMPQMVLQPQGHPIQAARDQEAIIYPPRTEAPVDYQLLLVTLAEEYFDSAFGSVPHQIKRETNMDTYYKLISTGLGCLESVLKRVHILLSSRSITSLISGRRVDYSLSLKLRSASNTPLFSFMKRRIICRPNRH